MGQVLQESDCPILVPNARLWMAKHHPDAIVRKEPTFSSDKNIRDATAADWADITSTRYIQLTDAIAHLLGEGTFEGWPLRTAANAAETVPTKIAMFPSIDLASVLTLEAVFKRGQHALMLSPRNSLPILVEIMIEEKVDYIVYSPMYSAVAKALAAKLESQSIPVKVGEVPSLKAIQARAEKGEQFPYDLDVKTEWDMPIFSLHTSGSSGARPTICAYTHRVVILQGLCTRFPGCTFKSYASNAPLYHALGIIVGINHTCLTGNTLVSAPPGPPLVGADLAHFLRVTQSEIALMVPQQIDSLVPVPGGLETLAALKMLRYGGAALRADTKKALDEAKVNYVSGYGSTEAGIISWTRPDQWPQGKPLDREWMKVFDALTYRFEVFCEAEGDLPKLWSLATMPGKTPMPIGLDEYDTGDLVERHPDYPDWIRVWGRKSNMIVLGNGENAPVRPLEEAAEAHPWITTALLFGKGQTQVGLLVELDDDHAVDSDDQQAVARARDEIWPAFAAVNEELPDFAKLFKNMIVFTSPGEPLPRTDKGTPKRHLSLKMYEARIDALYADVAAGSGASVHLRSIDPRDLFEMVNQTLVGVYGDAAKDLKPDTSLTHQLGQDSLRATMTRTAIVSSLRAAKKDGAIPELATFEPTTISPLITYEHGTPQTLADALHALITEQGGGSTDNSAEQLGLMREMIAKYSQELDRSFDATEKITQRRNGAGARKHTVLLTGSTGAFGTSILEQLVNHPDVEKVLCLVRTSSADPSAARERQKEAFLSKGLSPAPALSDKVEYMRGTASDPSLSIPDGITAIVHAAWSVNFNLTLKDFTPEIEGTVRLLQYCQRTGARLVFASSVSTTMFASASVDQQSNGADKPALIEVDEKEQAPLEWAYLGYGRSKAVVEKLISHAVHKAGVQAVNIRCGQIMGDSRSGSWNAAEWCPSIIRSARALGELPDNLGGVVDWLTVNDAMQVFVAAAVEDEVPSATPASETNTINLVNPNRTNWLAMMTAFKAHLPESVKIVPTQKWIQTLEAAQRKLDDDAADQKAELARIPALVLLPTYQGMASGATQVLIKVGEATRLTHGKLEDAATVDEVFAGRCIEFWDKRDHA
ncbi:hypothetical protein V8E36_001973 [Tilletia maclaganii]